MSVIGGLFKSAGSAAWTTGKFGLGTNIGRIGVGATVGGGMGFAAGDEYTSFNSRFNRAIFGAVGGAAAAGGFNIATSRIAGQVYKSAANSAYGMAKNTAKGLGKQTFEAGRWAALGMKQAAAMFKSGYSMDSVGFTARAALSGGISRSPIGSLGRGARLVKDNAYLAVPVVGAAAIGGGAIMANSKINDNRRRARVARFQESTGGLVQGAHSSRHGGR